MRKSMSTKLNTFLLLLVFSISTGQVIAQNTNGIFFQAVARDNFSNPAKDRKIYVQSSIIQTTPTGTKVLTEEHQANTDATGVFSISLGNGIRLGGTASGLTTIDWSKGPFYLNLKVAITPIGGSSSWDYTKEWVDMGTTSFGAVPFALYSASSAKVDDKLNITDTTKMLAVYAKAMSVKSLETAVASKLTAADTLTMLAPYAKAAFTIDSSFFKTQLATKLSLADSTKYVTPTQLASYNFSSGGGNTRIVTIDTSSLSNRINLKANVSDINTALASKASFDSPTFIGIVSATTANVGNISTQVATTAFVNNAISSINAMSLSGTVSVLNGGTGANSLTGLIKGNGTSPFTTAIAGTDYQAPIILTTTGSGAATLSGTTINIPTPSTLPTASSTILGGIIVGNNLNIDGSGVLSANINAGSISGTVAVSNGGTGQTSISGIQSSLGLAGSKVAIGSTSGQTSQGSGAVALGAGSGQTNQGSQSVAIGYVAGYNNQGANSVAIGSNAAQSGQGTSAVAIGLAATSGGNNSVALGGFASSSYSNSTAIGYQAVASAPNTIQLGADGVSISGSTAVTNVRTSGTLTVGTVTYPNVHGSSNQVLTTTGSGTLTWTTPSTGNSNTHSIGESYGGGIVFYTWDNGAHGLIVSKTDQCCVAPISGKFYAGTYTRTMARNGSGGANTSAETNYASIIGGGVGAGKKNTLLILSSQGYGDGSMYAARYANEYSVTEGGVLYDDWYLGSVDEYHLLANNYNQIKSISGFTEVQSDKDYWTSTEIDQNNAYTVYIKCVSSSNIFRVFPNGKSFTSSGGYGNVRAIRSF